MTQANEPMTASWKRAVLPAILLLALNLFVFGTMTVYFGNQGEFLVEDEDILKVLLIPAGALVLLLALVTVPLSRWRPAATGAVVSFLALVTYLHGNVLRWETGILDGAALRSDRVWPLVADAALWIVLAAVIWRYRRWLAVHGWKLCILLMVFQLIGAVDLKHNAKTGNRELQEVPTALYAFNAGPNVVHLILDGFQGNVFESLLDEDPSLATELAGFTFFRDAVTPSAVTYLSVPATLTGRAFDNSITITQYHDETLGGDNLYSFLAGNGYDVDVATPLWWNLDRDYFASYYRVPAPFASVDDTIRSTAWYLLDISLYRQAPYWLKSLVYRDGDWLFSSELARHPEQRFEHYAHTAFLRHLAANANAERGRPTYKLLHLITPHAPLVSDPECGYPGHELEATLATFADQSRCTMVAVRAFFRRLKELGVYDDALILVHGDHGGGVAFDMTAADGSPSNSFEELPGLWGNPLPLLLVKPPGAGAPLAVAENPVSLVDLPATVADLLGAASGFPGRSVFAGGAEKRPRMYYSSTQHRNEAAEKGRFANYTAYAVTGSIFDAAAWSEVAHFEAGDDALAGVYQWGTPLTFGRSGSFKPYGDGGWTVTRGNEINWTQGTETGLLIPVPETGRDVRMTFKVRPLLEPGKLERQRVRVTANGATVGELELTEARFESHALRIPAAATAGGKLAIRFHLPDAVAPVTLGTGEDDRELALAFLEVRFDPVD
ncbi:MAG: sulfatase-like hydrolase/transferase [Xanthomonadales bacterium]